VSPYIWAWIVLAAAMLAFSIGMAAVFGVP
jgi:hypothetical protein